MKLFAILSVPFCIFIGQTSAQNQKPSGLILFVGSSMTGRFETNILFPKLKTQNVGQDGLSSEGLLANLELVIALNPKKIFLEIGINDLLLSTGLENLKSNYSRIVDRLQSELPQCSIVLQTMLPVGDSVMNAKDLETHWQQDAKFVPLQTNKQIIDFNDFLQKFSSERKLKLINSYPHFLKKGSLNKKYDSGDGIHINEKGYKLWAKLLKPHL